MHNNINSDLKNDFFETNKRGKKNKRAPKRENIQQQINFDLRKILPKTKNQIRTFDEYEIGNHLLLQGVAGTGKTFISLYLALNEVLSGKSEKKKVVIVRSVVPTRDMGFLPGSQKEKQKVYEAPYYSIFAELFGRGDAYEYLKTKGVVDFISTSYIRGLTLTDSIIVVDEMQNLSFHELDSIVTRIGLNTRILFCGDFRQSDLEWQGDRRGILDFMRVINTIGAFKTISFDEDDIVRSKLVRDYILAKLELGIFT